MADCIDTSMHPMQTPCVDAPSHGALAEAEAIELAHRYNSMLLVRDPRD